MHSTRFHIGSEFAEIVFLSALFGSLAAGVCVLHPTDGATQSQHHHYVHYHHHQQ